MAISAANRPQTVVYRGALYDLVSGEEEKAQLVLAAAPKTEEEWREFAVDVADFYDAQLQKLAQLDEISQALEPYRVSFDAVQKGMRKARQSRDIRDIREALEAIKSFQNQVVRGSLRTLKRNRAALRTISKWGVQHEELKSKIERALSPESKLERWLT